MWPRSAGKGTADYVEQAASPLNRDQFEHDLREFVERKFLERQEGLAPELSETDFQELFGISEEYVRNLNATYSMKKDKITQDWKRRKKLMVKITKEIWSCRRFVAASIADTRWPATALLSKSIDKQLARFLSRVTREFEGISDHQRLSESMFRALARKYLRHSFVAELDHYIGLVAFPHLGPKQWNILIAATMSAARTFTKREQAGDVVERIAMARSRANAFINREIRDRGDAPVFRTKPRNLSAIR